MCARFLGKENNTLTKLVSRPARSVGRNDNISAVSQDVAELKQCTGSKFRTRTTNDVIIEAMDCIAQQIAIVAGADQSRAMTIWEETAQDQRENQQSIVPKRADVIFGDRLADNSRAIIDFKTQGAPKQL